MNTHREAVSQYALDRFIRGRLIVAHGLDCDCVKRQITICECPANADGRNWEIDPRALSTPCATALLSAGEQAAARLNLQISSML